jgi:hypothetical protein
MVNLLLIRGSGVVEAATATVLGALNIGGANEPASGTDLLLIQGSGVVEAAAAILLGARNKREAANEPATGTDFLPSAAALDVTTFGLETSVHEQAYW